MVRAGNGYWTIDNSSHLPPIVAPRYTSGRDDRSLQDSRGAAELGGGCCHGDAGAAGDSGEVSIRADRVHDEAVCEAALYGFAVGGSVDHVSVGEDQEEGGEGVVRSGAAAARGEV